MNFSLSVRRFVIPGFILALMVMVGGFLLTQKLRERARARATLERFKGEAQRWDPEFPRQTNLQSTIDRLRALGGEVVHPMIEDLEYDPAYVRLLRKVPFLQQFSLLGDTSFNRLMAAGYLGLLGPQAAPAIEPLIDHLSDSNPGVRFESARALGRIAGNHAHARAALTVRLQGSDAQLAYAAAVALWQMNPDDEGLRKRIEAFMGTASIEDTSRLFLDLGPAGRIFTVPLQRRLQGVPVDNNRILADFILWQWTGDKQPALRDLDFVATALPGSLATPVSGKSDPAIVILHAAQILDGDPSFRNRLKPLLEIIIERSAGGKRPAAEQGLKHLNLVDQHEAKSVRQAQLPGHP